MARVIAPAISFWCELDESITPPGFSQFLFDGRYRGDRAAHPWLSLSPNLPSQWKGGLIGCLG
jgi:hypothetical protein